METRNNAVEDNKDGNDCVKFIGELFAWDVLSISGSHQAHTTGSSPSDIISRAHARNLAISDKGEVSNDIRENDDAERNQDILKHGVVRN